MRLPPRVLPLGVPLHGVLRWRLHTAVVWGIDAIVWFYGGQIGSRLLSAVVTIGIAAFIAAAIWEASNALLERQFGMRTPGEMPTV